MATLAFELSLTTMEFMGLTWPKLLWYKSSCCCSFFAFNLLMPGGNKKVTHT